MQAQTYFVALTYDTDRLLAYGKNHNSVNDEASEALERAKQEELAFDVYEVRVEVVQGEEVLLLAHCERPFDFVDPDMDAAELIHHLRAA